MMPSTVLRHLGILCVLVAPLLCGSKACAGDLKSRVTLTGHKSHVMAVALTTDGTLLASGTSDGQVTLWDVDQKKERATLAAHTEPVTALAFTGDGKLLVSGGADYLARVWDVASGKERFT